MIRRRARALSLACASVGSLQIRNRGTIGGNLGNASPAADSVPALACLEAEVGSEPGWRECEAAAYRTLYRSYFAAATEGLVARWRGSAQAARA